MKSFLRLLSFFLIICLIIIFSACNFFNKTEIRLHILHFENSVGEKGITTFKYDNSGLKTGAKWELLDGSRYSENYFTYDTHGNLIYKYREFSDSLVSHTWYTYNEKNLLVKEKFFRSDSIEGITYYKYEDNNRLINMDCQGFNGWFYGLVEMKYNEKGEKLGATIMNTDIEIGFINYEYENNLLVKEYWEFNQGYNHTFIHEYETYQEAERLAYPSSNVYITNVFDYKVNLEEYDYNNEGGGPSYFDYDDKGKLLKKTFVRADGLKTITDFEYNENGLLTKSIRNYNLGKKGVFNYKFNGNKRLIKKTFSLPENVEGYEKYEYNGKMQLTKAKLRNFDTWITGTIDFEYDEDDQLSRGHFKGDQFNAEIHFTVDENNNVVKYIWELSYGATQTYNFTYEKLN